MATAVDFCLCEINFSLLDTHALIYERWLILIHSARLNYIFRNKVPKPMENCF